MACAAHLPGGVALVRVNTPVGRLVLASDRLTEEEQSAARLIAATMTRMGFRAIVLRFSDLLRTIDDARKDYDASLAR